MNFDHVNKVSDYCRDEIMPHLSSKVQLADFGHYLSRLSEHPNFKWMHQELRAYPLVYFVDPVEFVKKYAKKCVGYMGSSSPQEGSMHIVYQISPTFHVLARLYHWVEHEKVRAYLMLTCAYREHSEYLAFFDENKSLRLTGNTEERQAGFRAGVSSNPSGIEELLKGFASKNARNEESDEVEETP